MMKQDFDKHRLSASSWNLRRLLPYTPLLFLVLFVPVLLFGALALTGDSAVQSRIFGVGAIALIVGLAWIDNRADMLSKEGPWRELAERTGLHCHARGLLLGSSVHVAGTYRQRPLTLYAQKQGKGQVQSTRIELHVNNPARASLRLRGPFTRDSALTDSVTRNLFQTTDAQQIGQERSFFIRSQPLYLATVLPHTRPLWDRLLALEPLINIELDGHTLSFDRLGVLTDVDELHALFELLSDLADSIEQRESLLRG
jgi:hypothetical protein